MGNMYLCKESRKLLLLLAIKTGVNLTFPRYTFSCKLRDKKFPSNSTCKYELVFLRTSSFITKAKSTMIQSGLKMVDPNICTLVEVAQLQRKVTPFRKKLKSIKFSGGEVFRYLGCTSCTSSIPRAHTDGKFYCKGMCNSKRVRKSKIGVETKRKICIMVYDVKMSDKKGAIDSVVIFNKVCEKLLKKNGSDFDSDNEAITAWNDMIMKHCFDITMKRDKKKEKSKFPPTVLVESINNEIAISQSKVESDSIDNEIATSQSNVESEYSVDASENQNDDEIETGVDLNNASICGEKKRERLPDFRTYDMKLQRLTTVQYKTQNWALPYQIASTPPRGIVLLINNLNFPHRTVEEEQYRSGSEVDIDLLYKGFKEMGYEIYKNICHLDLATRNDYYELLNDFKRELVEKDADSCFVVISSHGHTYEVSLTGQKCETVNVIEDILIPFSDEKFCEFQGKPKIFMPITCQNLGALTKGIQKPLYFLANHLFDMMICFPCLPGYDQRRYQRRSREYGSLFVNYLMYNLMTHATSWHFIQILEKVQADIKKQIKKKKLSITLPYWITSTFRKLYLIPNSNFNDHENGNVFGQMDVD